MDKAVTEEIYDLALKSITSRLFTHYEYNLLDCSLTSAKDREIAREVQVRVC